MQQKLVEMAGRDLKMAQNKVRFIKAVRTGEIKLFDMDKEGLHTKLREMQFEEFEQAKPSWENQDGAKAQGIIRGYDYLLCLIYVFLLTKNIYFHLKYSWLSCYGFSLFGWWIVLRCVTTEQEPELSTKSEMNSANLLHLIKI